MLGGSVAAGRVRWGTRKTIGRKAAFCYTKYLAGYESHHLEACGRRVEAVEKTPGPGSGQAADGEASDWPASLVPKATLLKGSQNVFLGWLHS